MRLDLFLKTTCLVKRRTKSNLMIKVGSVYVNGVPSKPSREVKVGDIIEIQGRRIKVKEIPVSKNISKDEIYNYIEEL